MSTFQAWLESLDQRRTVLLEVDFLNGGSSGTLRLSNRPFRSSPSDSLASVPYDDAILGGLTYTRKMSGQESGSLGFSVGSVVLAASPEVQEASAFEFSGQQARVLLGDSRWNRDSFQLVAVLAVDSLEPEGISQFRLNFRTERLDLEKALNPTVFTAEGPNKDKNRPILLGDCLNVRPLQVDAAGLTWAISDGPVSSIGTVRVDGVPATVTRNASAGTITFSSAPSGVVTCDAVGQAGAKLKDVVLFILGRLGVTSIDSASLNALPSVDVGLSSGSALPYREALDQLLRSIGGFWGFDRLGRFKAGRVLKPTGSPTATLTPDDINEDGVAFLSRVRPAQWVDLLYDLNQTNQGGDLAGVSPADRAFWSSPGKTVRAENAGILTLYPDAEQRKATTLLRGVTAATDEANRRRVLYGTPLRIFRVDAFAVPFAFEVGQEIRLVYPYLGMSSGVPAIVLSILDDPLAGTTSLEVLI